MPYEQVFVFIEKLQKQIVSQVQQQQELANTDNNFKMNKMS
jgi:hypothetical protein